MVGRLASEHLRELGATAKQIAEQGGRISHAWSDRGICCELRFRETVASRAGVDWRGPPYDSADFENALCIFQERRSGVGWNSNRRTESFLPKLTAESARVSRRMEAAGIEPASADAPV
jgi:hypothetical protein